MIILLSPAKTLQFDIDLPAIEMSRPHFHRQANEIVDELKHCSQAKIKKLMNVSDELSAKTLKQFQSFRKKFDCQASRPAGFVYQGDVYQGLEFATLDESSQMHANENLVILSGLYGMLRPLNRIQPYRLEMGTKLETETAKNLYEFWSERLTRQLKKRLAEQPDQLIVNLASSEYSKTIDFKQLKAPVIEPNFKEEKDGKVRFLSFYGKRSRGLMARYLIESRASSESEVNAFNLEGYRLSNSHSKPGRPTFVRKQPPPISQRLPA